MNKKPNSGSFKKGHKGGPGRPRVLVPAVQNLIDENRNAIRVLLLEEFNRIGEENIPKIRFAIRQSIDRAINDGDAIKLKILLEMALGKLDLAPDQLELTSEEKLMVLSYREKLAEQQRQQRALETGETDAQGSARPEGELSSGG